ncbi:TPA: hypothetical protein SMP92_001645 [Pseudomonas putida]|nr:hypothetical protein [Pseudomonas putida]
MIVHNSGVVKNKEKVIERIFRDCGINDRDKPALSLKANKFFSKLKSSEETHVFLLGHTDPTYGIFSTFNLSDLLSLMMSYAQILAELSLRHLYNNDLLKPRENQE